MDVVNKKDFEYYYHNGYEDTIKNYYEQIKKRKLMTLIGGVIIFSLLLFVPVLADSLLNVSLVCTKYYLIYCIILSGVAFSFISSCLIKIMSGLSRCIFKDLLVFISNSSESDVEYEEHQRLSQDSLSKMDLFNLDVVKYNGCNYTRVAYYKSTLILSDIKTYIPETVTTQKNVYRNGKQYIRTTHHQKNHTIFRGLYFGATLNKKNSTHIYLIPNTLNDRFIQSKIMSYIKYHGVPVELENLQFSKKYKVFCDDEIQARYILSLSLMERINNLDNTFPNKKYIVFKDGKKFAICIEGLTIQDILKTHLPVFRNMNREQTQLNKMFDQINKIFSIYHTLDLGNDLYSKYVD